MCSQIILRQWKDSDLEPYIEMNADPEVMRFFPKTLTAEESAASFERLSKAIDERGWGLWAVEVDSLFAGFTGLRPIGPEFPFGPNVEIGWRFRREYWGKGIAYAAARDAEKFALQTLKLPELVTFTATINQRSIRLMERLSFLRDSQGDFLHPSIPEAHPLCLHVLYRKNRL